MKKYNVTVNGNLYEITLEAVDAADIKAPAAAPAPAAPAKVETAPTPAPAKAEGGETIASPMPGTILNVNVQNGATVKKGDVLMILEAMKMENEIMAPCDGTVTSVNVQKGASVNTDEVLVTLN